MTQSWRTLHSGHSVDYSRQTSRYNYNKCATSYSGIDIYEASLYNYYNNDVSAEDAEIDEEEFEYGPCQVDLNRVPVIS